MSPQITLRDVVDSDLPIFFENQRDPFAVKMADFPPRDEAAFYQHWREKVFKSLTTKVRTIVVNGEVVGDVLSFIHLDRLTVGYWIGRKYWGQGIATAALAQFLETEQKERPLYADLAFENTASRRVLEKCGFRPHGPVTTAPDGSQDLTMILV